MIRGYTINVDPAALGKPMTAFIRLVAAFDDRYDSGIKSIGEDPDVLECYNVAGEDCLVLKTKCGSPSDLEGLLGRIRSRLTVQRSVTMIALRALKENAPLNVLSKAEESAAKRTKA